MTNITSSGAPEINLPVERDIIRECRAGNTARFGELYDGYVRKIYRYIYYKTLHKETAEDITADVFLKALKNIRKFDPAQNFSPWIYSIARNSVIDHFRTRHLNRNIEDIWDLADDENIAEKTDVKINFSRIRSALEGLTPRERNILVMRIWDDMSYKEIAEITGESEVNCKVIFSRTASKLRSGALAVLILLIVLKSW